MITPIAELPRPRTAENAPRRVGIEVECGGLTEGDLAREIANVVGGVVRETAAYERLVENSELGDVEVLLDTALREKAAGSFARAGLSLGRAVIPVEFVTEPILPEKIARVDAVCRVLAQKGAFGTREGLTSGFGVHLNVALPGTEINDVLPVVTMFALIEDWMRDRMKIDTARRVQPFVGTYDTPFVDQLCTPNLDWDMDMLTGVYLRLAGTRNHALDVLPILKYLDPDRVEREVPEMKTKTGRPAWHYRLPDCRIDDPEWSVVLEWNRWVGIERCSADPGLMARLIQAWRDYRRRALPIPGRWAAVSAEILDKEDPFR